MFNQIITTISLINTDDCIITPSGIMTKNPTKLCVNENHLQIIGKPLGFNDYNDSNKIEKLTFGYYWSVYFFKNYICKPINYICNTIYSKPILDSEVLDSEVLDTDEYKDKHFHQFDFKINTFNLSNLSTYNCSTNLIGDDILINVDSESNFFLIDTSKKLYPKIRANVSALAQIRIFVQSMGDLEIHLSDNSEATLFLSHSKSLNLFLDKNSKITIQQIDKYNYIDNLQVKAINSSRVVIKSTICKIIHSIYLDNSNIVFNNSCIKKIKKKSVNNNSCFIEMNVNKNI